MSTEQTSFPCVAPRERGSTASISVHSQLAGMLWCAAWLFTIGYLKLVWWKALLGLLLWPYFLGAGLR